MSGALALMAGQQVAGPLYDAMLHTFFLGFVFGMIFGHAPIIFPFSGSYYESSAPVVCNSRDRRSHFSSSTIR